MTDKELLDLAAKAAGLGEVLAMPMSRTEVSYVVEEFDGGPLRPWNPFEDDGDALRLAVELGVKLRWHPVLRQALAWIPIDIEIRVGIEECSGAGAATRRAIVLAATEMGKAMQEKH